MCALKTNNTATANNAIFVIDELHSFDASICFGMQRQDLAIPVFDRQLELVISFVDGFVKIKDLVPIAQSLCDRITSETIRCAKNLGWNIPCRKGCAKCCRNLIPLSTPEALWLYEQIHQMPRAEKKVFLRSVEFAGRKLTAEKPPKLNDENAQKQLSDWYSNLNLACPFLVNNCCEIYNLRPLACREHLAIGSLACGENENKNQLLKLPTSILEAFAELCNEFELQETNAVMLPVAFGWARENIDKHQKIYPLSVLMKRFIEIITSSL